jgi:uncharacterized protein (TIGR02246 family)
MQRIHRGLAHGMRAAVLTITLVVQLAIGLTLPATSLAANPAVNITSCAPVSRTEVEQLFDRWNTALASGDPGRVAALYSADALLLPTLSDQPRDTPAAIRDYFAGFLTRSPRGRIDSRRISLGCNQALDAGTYSFQLQDPEGGTPQWVQARFSFVYSHGDDGWRILHHHSSLQPG